MLWGGAGSSKTWTILKTVFLRALLLNGSRHICLRQRFEHAKNTLWPSAKELMNAEWPGLWEQIETNKSGGTWFIKFPNDSEVLFGGLDDKERVEKHLGAEYATVYINECSEIQDERAVDLISSRLRQKIDGRHLLMLDMNPPSKSHWSYKRYIETKTSGRAAFRINPIDVKENLPPSYIARLEALPERLRQRFLYGEFTTDIEGALWSWDMIEGTRTPLDGVEGRTVVAIDPAVTNNEHSDETGIIVAAKKGTGMIVLEDLSTKATPNEWARIAISAYYKHDADSIVVEVNNGGDMIKTILSQLDPTIRIKEVRATKGKHIRAEPVVAL
ncbi:MAG: phage terminase large subunit, partial [Methanosarcinaceae archaeon]|nr:phage terminase large subunit [Methanosarcinaceae archaeon]